MVMVVSPFIQAKALQDGVAANKDAPSNPPKHAGNPITWAATTFQERDRIINRAVPFMVMMMVVVTHVLFLQLISFPALARIPQTPKTDQDTFFEESLAWEENEAFCSINEK